jgi:hypothetical protein
MITIITWLFSGVMKYVSIGVLILALLFGFKMYMRHVHNAEVRAKVAEQNLKVYKEDIATQQMLEQMTVPEIAEYFRTGKAPNRLKEKHHAK